MILFDLETVRRLDNPEPDPGPVPKNLKKPEAIENWRVAKVASMKKAESLSPSTGQVILVSAACDDGPVMQWYGHDERMLLDGFHAWVRTCDAIPENPEDGSPTSYLHSLERRPEPHALCAYFGTTFDFWFLAHRASVHGLASLAARAYCRTRYGDSMHVDPGPDYDCKLGIASASYGHKHPSMKGGASVGDWWLAGNESAIKHHGYDDIEALRVVVKHGHMFLRPTR